MDLRPALGRPLDLAYSSNVFVLVVTLVIGVIAGVTALVRSESLLDSVGWAVSAVGAGFLAWAIGRELHPDRPGVAAVATLVAPFGVLVSRPDLLAAALVLLVARAVAGTVGRSMRAPDALMYLVVGGLVAVRDSAPGILACAAIAMALFTRLDAKSRPWSLIVMVAYAGGAILAVGDADVAAVSATGWWVAGIGVVFGLVALRGPAVVSVGCDVEGRTIRASRVRWARAVALVMSAGVSVTADPTVMIPVYAALAATALRP